MAPFGLKLCQNAFQMIPDVHARNGTRNGARNGALTVWAAVVLRILCGGARGGARRIWGHRSPKPMLQSKKSIMTEHTLTHED